MEYLTRVRSAGKATEKELLACVHDVATASRNYVKNQTTWFRDEAMFRWLDVSLPQEQVGGF